MTDIEALFVHLARLVGLERQADARALAKRSLGSLMKRRPDLSQGILEAQRALAGSPTRSAYQDAAVPVDLDSRLELLRRDESPGVYPEPVWPEPVAQALGEVLVERSREAELLAEGLPPTKSLLFVGPPGVGKTLAAKWLASHLGRPLLTLDLAAVMSSFLGRTGNNIRSVLDYAQRLPCVLLLDEFDAVAKRRDDATEIGELKRLVTVLLQTIDEWPSSGMLIAATNHPELLDPAVWRRFDRIIDFPLPSLHAAQDVISRLLERSAVGPDAITALAIAVEGESFADITRRVVGLRRKALVEHQDLSKSILELAGHLAQRQGRDSLMKIVGSLHAAGYSQRRISTITGVSRDTMRRHNIGSQGGDNGTK